jgi:Tol biopolymer transport system component
LRIERAGEDKSLSDLNKASKKDKKKGREVLSHNRMRFSVFVTSAILLLLLSSFFAVQSNQGAWASTFSGPNGKIAFVRGPPGDTESFEIYVMNADGSGQTRLTNNDASDGDPSWSPDGSQIVFTSNRDDGNFDIYVMNADDGSDVTRLTNNNAADGDPSWSPDGSQIVFTSNRESGNLGVYVMNADDGSDVTRLTGSTDNDSTEPSWSPDDTRIAFVSNRDSSDSDDNAIYSMNADDGSDVTRLTGTGADHSVPDWGTNRPISSNNNNNDNDNGDDSSTTTTSTSTDSGTSTTTSNSITSASRQAIDKAISTIQNQDTIPQNMRTNIVTMMEGISNYVNNKVQTTMDQALARFLVP